MKQHLKSGIFWAVIAAIVSGFSIFYNKLVIVKGIDPLIFNILKNGGVAILITGVLLSSKRLPLLLHVSKKQWIKLWSIAIIGGSIPFVLYFEGLRSMPAINANLLQKTMFIWVAMFAVPLLGERLNAIQIIGFLLVAWSNLFIGGFTGFSFSRPELLVLSATLLWSIENIIVKITLKNTDTLIVTWARMFLGVGILLTYAATQGKIDSLFRLNSYQLLSIVGSIVFLTTYVISWYKALSVAPATMVTSILILATPVTNILSALFLTHTFPNSQLINLVGTTTGILLIVFLSKILKKNHSSVLPNVV